MVDALASHSIFFGNIKRRYLALTKDVQTKKGRKYYECINRNLASEKMEEKVTIGIKCGSTDVEAAGPRLSGNAPNLSKQNVRAAAISSLERFEGKEGKTGGGMEESVATDTSIEKVASENRNSNPKKRTIEELEGIEDKCPYDVKKSVTADMSIEETALGNGSPNPKKRAIEKFIIPQEVCVNASKGCSMSRNEEEDSEGNKPSTKIMKTAGHIINCGVSPIKRDNKKRVLIVTPNDSVEEYLNSCLRENECVVMAGVKRAEDIESDCDMVCIDCSALGLKDGLYFRHRMAMKRQNKSLVTLAIVMNATLRKAHPHAIRVLCESFTGICILPASKEDVRECLYNYLGVVSNNITQEASIIKQGKCYTDGMVPSVYEGRALRSSASLPRAILKRIDRWPDPPQVFFHSANRACLELFKCESSDLHGNPLSAFFSLNSGGDALRLVQCIQRHSPTCGKLPVFCQGKGTDEVSVSLKPLGDSYPDSNLSCLTIFPLEFW